MAAARRPDAARTPENGCSRRFCGEWLQPSVLRRVAAAVGSGNSDESAREIDHGMAVIGCHRWPMTAIPWAAALSMSVDDGGGVPSGRVTSRDAGDDSQAGNVNTAGAVGMRGSFGLARTDGISLGA
jgi:hypothetical protein